MKDFPISQLRAVQYRFRESSSHLTEKLMHESQVDTFLQALLKLHYSPGINPHNQNKCAELWEVQLGKLRLEPDSYWWSSPTLGVKPEVPGAQLNNIDSERLWAHPDFLKKEQEEADAEDEWERLNS